MRKLRKIENIYYLTKKNIAYSIVNSLTNNSIVLANNYLKATFKNFEQKKRGYRFLISHSYLKYHDTRFQHTKKAYYKLTELQSVITSSDSMLFLLSNKKGLLNCINLRYDYKHNGYIIVPYGSNTFLKKSLFVKTLFQKKQLKIKQCLNKIKILTVLKNKNLTCLKCDSQLLNLDIEVGKPTTPKKYEK